MDAIAPTAHIDLKEKDAALSSQTRQRAAERLEDETDAHDLEQAIADDNGERIEWSEVKRELKL